MTVRRGKVDEITMINAYLEYYGMAAKKPVDDMTDWEWALRWAILQDIKERESKG